MWLRNLMAALVAVVLGIAAGVTVLYSAPASSHTRTVVVGAPERVYIRNLAPHYISDKTIRKDIPAWEQAANKQFAPVWRVPHVRILMLGRKQPLPSGAILATFQQKGPITGALAFHESMMGNPGIVVYAGVSHYYGYSISEGFTHELFETMADHFVSAFNIGNPTTFYYVGSQPEIQPQYAPWFNEVCDPVEKYGYKLHGVQISDWITPSWFNDPGTAGAYDYMRLAQYPFQVLKGGYAQFVIDGQDNVVEDFKGAGADANGYLKAEGRDRS